MDVTRYDYSDGEAGVIVVDLPRQSSPDDQEVAVSRVESIEFTVEEVEPIVVDLRFLQEDLQRFAQLFGDEPPPLIVVPLVPKTPSREVLPEMEVATREVPDLSLPMSLPAFLPDSRMIAGSLELFLVPSAEVATLSENVTVVPSFLVSSTTTQYVVTHRSLTRNEDRARPNQSHSLMTNVSSPVVMSQAVDQRPRSLVDFVENVVHRGTRNVREAEENMASFERQRALKEVTVRQRVGTRGEREQRDDHGESLPFLGVQAMPPSATVLHRLIPRSQELASVFPWVMEVNVPFQFSVFLPGVTLPLIRLSMMAEADSDVIDHDRVLPPSGEEASHGEADAQSGHHSRQHHDEPS